MNLLKALNFNGKRHFCTSVRRKVDFFYDVISPYSWFSFEVLHRYNDIWNMELVLHPVLLGAIMKETSNPSPLTTSLVKGQYMPKDLRMCASYFDVPIIPTQKIGEITKGSLSASRLLTVLKMDYPEHLEEASRLFWMLRWNRDLDITTPESLKEVGEECGLTEEQAAYVFESISSDEVKDELRATTNMAIEYGAFGVPTMIVDDGENRDMFFGSDRFPVMAHLLDLPWTGPIPDPELMNN